MQCKRGDFIGRVGGRSESITDRSVVRGRAGATHDIVKLVEQQVLPRPLQIRRDGGAFGRDSRCGRSGFGHDELSFRATGFAFDTAVREVASGRMFVELITHDGHLSHGGIGFDRGEELADCAQLDFGKIGIVLQFSDPLQLASSRATAMITDTVEKHAVLHSRGEAHVDGFADLLFEMIRIGVGWLPVV